MKFMSALTEISGPPVDVSVSGRWIFDRVEHWVKQGAQPSAAVKKLIKRGKSEVTAQPAAAAK